MSDGRETDGPGTDGLSRKELLARSGAIGAGLVTVGSISPAAFAKAFQAPKPKRGGRLNWGLEVDPIHVAPFGEAAFGWLSREPSYDSLLEWSPGLNVRQALAESYKVVGPREILWNLRKGVRFHNGKELTAADVVYSNKLMLNPPPPGGTAALTFVPPIESVEAVSKYVVRMRTKAAYAPLFGFYAWNRFFNVVPEGLYEDINAARNAIGTGPYRMLGYTPADRVEFVRNPNFWKKGLPHLDAVTLLILPDEASRVAALRAGRIHGAVLSFAAASSFRGDSNYRVLSSPSAAFKELQFTIKPGESKPWADARVRQAINAAINRDAIIRTVYQGQADYSGHVPPRYGSWPLSDKELRTKWLKHDLAKARTLMRAAGYPNGFSVTMKVINNTPDIAPVAVVLEAQLSQIGVDLTVQLMTQAAAAADNLSGNFDFFLTQRGFRGDVDGYLAEFNPASTLYQAFFKNTQKNVKLWRLIGNSRITFDPKKRLKMVQDAERLMLTDMLQVPLVVPRIYHVVRKNVMNHFVNKSGNNQALRTDWFA
jgi:peptide/nickel transport system substrate-binding protein